MVGRGRRNVPDFLGGMVGGLSIIALVLIYRYADHLSDGNVGGDDD